MTAQELSVAQEAQLADATPGEIMMNAPLLAQIDSLAKRMATAKATIPSHLAGNEGDCWAVIMQAVQWRMNPFVVAQKTHIVQGKLGYEAQLVNAVVKASGAIEGAFKYEFEGEGEALKCRVGAVLKGESEITWGQWLTLSTVTVRNSPLWKTNPPQQLGYLQVKNFARLYCPEALLGIYTPDELQEMPPREREVGPRSSGLNDSVKQQDADSTVVEGEIVDVESAGAGMTYAEVCNAMNLAQSAEALSDAIPVIEEFLEHGDNDKYRDELLDVYRARKAQLEPAEEPQEEPANV